MWAVILGKCRLGLVVIVCNVLRETYGVCFFFFFQAEDGIRDLIVTGVQTCALPILQLRCARSAALDRSCTNAAAPSAMAVKARRAWRSRMAPADASTIPTERSKIGRASCRERV